MGFRRAVAIRLRKIANVLDPVPLRSQSIVTSRSPEEVLQSLREMAEARTVMQIFEFQAKLVSGKRLETH